MTSLLKVQVYFLRDHIRDKVWLGNNFWWELALVRFGLVTIFGGNCRWLGLVQKVFLVGTGADLVWLGEYFWGELALIRFGLESTLGGNWR